MAQERRLTIIQGNGENTEEHQIEEGVDEEDTGDKSDVEIITERPETEMDQSNGEQYGSGDNAQAQQEQDTTQANAQQGFGFNQNQQGFGNMDFNANGMNGFNPMMAMQNGMMPGFGMGMPNMMGKHFQYHHKRLHQKHMLHLHQVCPAWAWTSIRPGMTTFPDASIVRGDE